MDAIQQLQELSTPMELEPAGDVGPLRVSERQRDALCFSEAQMPGGKQITLLKTLLTSACERNCYYCPFRAGRDFRRASLRPDEMAGAFIAVQRAGVAQGLFLSSGIAGGSLRSQDRLLDTAEILRKKHHFRGYIHLKLMPGAEKEQVLEAMRLANRVSINLEAPNSQRLEALAPGKGFMDELLQPLRWVEDIRRNHRPPANSLGHWPSVTTQFVVGAAGESDLELLATTEALNRQVRLARAYYSAFSPKRDTPLENLPAESPVRQQRLYQASFLLRDYGFDLEEFSFTPDGRLPLDLDPKLAWARVYLAEAPVEINQADRGELLRIPGIGPKSAKAILQARRDGRLHNLEDLRRLGINPAPVAPFILLDGRQPARQLSLW